MPPVGIPGGGGRGVIRVASLVSYSTTFGANELTLSEGGIWTHNNVWFNECRSNGGIAYGKNPTPNPGNTLWDANAFASGLTWNANQYVSAHIHKGTTGDYMEVELFLRGSDTANSTSGYECYLHQGGAYVTVMKYNGATQTGYATYPGPVFTLVTEVAPLPSGQVPNHGDLFEAQIVGNIITVKLAGVTLITVDASTAGSVIANGSPGIGFMAGGGGGETANNNFGFQDFYATSL